MSDAGSKSDSESGGAASSASASASASASSQAEEDKTFSSQTISVRAQKKLVSKLASKRAVKVFIDATSARIFDRIYKIVKLHSGSRAKAQKLMKKIIKLNLKVGILYINDILSDQEKELADEFRDKFNDLANALVLMQRRKLQPDVESLKLQFSECEQLALRMIRRHLSEKSINSIQSSAQFFTDSHLLTKLFDPASNLSPEMEAICEDIQELLDRGIV